MKTVLLHGLGQSPRDWDGVTGQLPALDMDCPGLFSPAAAGPLTYSGILERLEARYAHTAEPLRLCGLSLGAVLALDYTIRHPDKVAALVWIAGQLRSPTALVDMQNLVFRCLPNGMFEGMGLSKQDAIQLARSMRSLDLTEGLDRVTCPVDVVCGQRDRANQKAARALAARLPRARLHIIPGAGHEINRDAPGAIARLLTNQ